MGRQRHHHLPTTPVNLNLTLTSLADAVPAFVQNSIPVCAQQCVLGVLQHNFRQGCLDISNLSCVCSRYGVDGYTIGESALGCLFSSSCNEEALSSATLAYTICDGTRNLVTPTPKSITITIIPTSTNTTIKSTSGTTPATTVMAPSSSTVTSVPSASSLSTVFSATSLPMQRSNPVPLTTAQIAGIAIASVALLVVIIAVCMCLFCLRRQDKRQQHVDDIKSVCPEYKRRPIIYSPHNFIPRDPNSGPERLGMSYFDWSPPVDTQRWPRYYRVSPPPNGLIFNATTQKRKSTSPEAQIVPRAIQDSTPQRSISSEQGTYSASSNQTARFIQPPPPIRDSRAARRSQNYRQQIHQQENISAYRASSQPESHDVPDPLRLSRPSNLTIKIPNLPSKPPPPPLKDFSPRMSAPEQRKEMPPASHKKSRNSKVTLAALSQAALGSPEADKPDATRPRRSSTRPRIRHTPQSVDRESVTSIESNGSYDDASDGDEPPLSAVPESPIAKLRYPKVPRDSNSRSSINLRVRTSRTSLYSAGTSPVKGKGANTIPSPSTTPLGSPARHTPWSPSTPVMRPRASPRSTPSPNVSSASSGYRGVEDKLWRTEVSPTTVAQVRYPEPEHNYPYSSYSHIQYFGQAPVPPQTPDSGTSQSLQIPQNAAWKREPPTRQWHSGAPPPMSPFGATPTLTPTKLGNDLYISVRR